MEFSDNIDFLSKVHQELGLSPGYATEFCAKVRNKDVERKRKVIKTTKYKVCTFLLEI